MTPEKNSNVDSPKIIVRILKGILRGCDFTLVPGETFFFIGDEETISQHQKYNNDRFELIYIPTEKADASCRFAINASFTDDAPAISFIEGEGVEENCIDLCFNQIIDVGGISLSIRPFYEKFDDSKLYYPEAEVNKKNNKSVAFYGKTKYLLPIAILLVGCALTYGIMNNEGKHIASITSVIDQNASAYTLLHGRDGAYYVMTSSEADANWISQTLNRRNLPYDVRVVTVRRENYRATELFKVSMPTVRFHRILITDSGDVTVELSKERNRLNESEKKAIIKKLRDHIAYAEDVKLDFISDYVVSNIAEEDLKKIFVEYTKVKNEDSITFVLTGSINDAELERIKLFINNYYLRWGGEYVTFALELKDDWLRGKSFKYGDRGYIKLSPGHWYFPKPL
ncbi:PrgH/EprH family type III secretion apparatus protein [Enterobacter huaxiensis]|uniref:PrgH/EprH family type III secretion apparatus protein n=1 Tax=Enterobacter huaxiensis TaxID=2494702 RepID=UPI0021DB3C1B|nr:PrgH/EprH family type III secretion apparatus protein [Enterobacter huaxiensis]